MTTGLFNLTFGWCYHQSMKIGDDKTSHREIWNGADSSLFKTTDCFTLALKPLLRSQ